MSNLDKVREFHKVFGHPAPDHPTIGDAKTRELRIKLVADELQELAEALGYQLFMTPRYGAELVKMTDKVDLVETADALTTALDAGTLRGVVVSTPHGAPTSVIQEFTY